MGEYKRFKADCWNINMNFESSACITSQSDDELKVDGTFRTNSDIVGLFWNSSDIILHDLLKYPTNKDYSETVFNFDFETEGFNLLAGDIALKKENGCTYYINFNNLVSTKTDASKVIPPNVSSFLVGNNIINSGFIVRSSLGRTLKGLKERLVDAVVTEGGSLILPQATTGTVKYKYYVPNEEEILTELTTVKEVEGFKLTKENIISNSLNVYDEHNTLLVRSNSPVTVGFTYDSFNRTVHLLSNSSFPYNQCFVSYDLEREITESIDFVDFQTKHTLSKRNVKEGSLVVKDSKGNVLQRNYNLSDYCYYPDSHEVMITANLTGTVEVKYKSITGYNETILELDSVSENDKYYPFGFTKKVKVSSNDMPYSVTNSKGEWVEHSIIQDNESYYLYLKTPDLSVNAVFKEYEEISSTTECGGIWTRIQLDSDSVVENSLIVYLNGTILTKGGTPREYIYDMENNQIQLLSNNCKQGVKVSYKIDLGQSSERIILANNQTEFKLSSNYVVDESIKVYANDGTNKINIERLDSSDLVIGDYYYNEELNLIIPHSNKCVSGCTAKFTVVPHEVVKVDFKEKLVKQFKSDRLEKIVLPETDVIHETVEVKDSNGNVLIADPLEGDYILDKSNGKILFLTDRCDGMTLSYHTETTPVDPIPITNNTLWGKVDLDLSGFTNPEVSVVDSDGNTLKGASTDTDFTYYFESNEIQPHSSRCANGVKVSYVTKSTELITETIDPTWEIVALSHGDIIKESLEVYDSQGNLMKGGFTYEDDSDYVIYWNGDYNPYVNESNPLYGTYPRIHGKGSWWPNGGATVKYQVASNTTEETIHFNNNWEKVHLSHDDIYNGTLTIKDLNGNTLKERGGQDYTLDPQSKQIIYNTDYIWYPSGAIQPVNAKGVNCTIQVIEKNVAITEHLNGTVGDYIQLQYGNIIETGLSCKDSNGQTLYRNTTAKNYIYVKEKNTVCPISESCKGGTVSYGLWSSEFEPIALKYKGIFKETVRFENKEKEKLYYEEFKDWLLNEEEGIFYPLNYEMIRSIIIYLSEENIATKTETFTNTSKVLLSKGEYIQLDELNKLLDDTNIEVIDSNNHSFDVVSVDNTMDYVFNTNKGLLIPIKPSCNNGTIKYSYASGIEMDFDSLSSTGVKGAYNGDGFWNVDPNGIEEILIPLIPPVYSENSYLSIPNSEYSLHMYNMKTTNDFLGYELDLDFNHNYRLAEGYDDSYNLCPRRLAYMMSRLGYKEWLDLYIGATHYYEKINNTNIIRPDSPTKVTYSTMTTDTTTPLNNAFRIWFDDYCKWSKYYGMNNIVVSVSLENLQMPYEWKQLLWDGTPGGTGWTPSTNFFSLCNTNVRDYIQTVCEACLDILVDNGLPPILQWGEPWWWWQELYPESISIDPNNQTTKSEKYPGQPPAFYDQATKDKYFRETGKQLPVYKSSTDKYDPEVIAWLRHQLADYSDFMRSIVKSNKYENGIYTVLYFPPSIMDTDRVPPMMQEVNYPVEAWNEGQCDFLQLEDYDWVITEDPKHESIWEFGQKMNYPNHKIHYFAGYNQYPKDAPRIWPLIEDALVEGVNHNMAEVYVWAGTQIRRDNIVLDVQNNLLEIFSTVKNKEIAAPLLNIIVLTPDEKTIKWLIPDLTGIVEINETNTVRKVQITYPLDEKMTDDVWFNQGNKIFIPKIFGLSSCLYVINTSYKLDYWEENTVTVEAEEVLTELNYQVVAVYKDNIKITKNQLTEWFGNFYLIEDIEELDSTKNTIEALGTTTLMTLLRTIEEKTERIFVTKYVYKNNQIYRSLSLVNEDTLREVAGTEYLDLNYNMDSLELEVDEDNVYNAMAPILNFQKQENTGTSADYVNLNDSLTSQNVETTESAEDVYKKWLELEVQYREYIPMIRKKESDGSIVTTARWYAPFQKLKNKLYIEHVGYMSSNYNSLQPPANGNGVPNPLPKMGTVTTSETDPYAIFNVLANSLLDKVNPSFKLTLKVKDISELLGVSSLGYNIYETLYVKIPGFDYYVPAYITKTTKNPHLPGNDTISVETDVRGSHLTKPTEISSNDQIVPAGTNAITVGGILSCENSPVEGQLVSVNVRLAEPYSEALPVTPEIKVFKPETETYYFTDTDIWELEKNLRTGCVLNNYAKEYIMYDIRGDAYSVPLDWCLAIYYSFIQYFITTDYPIGEGTFASTLPVHYYSDSGTYLQKSADLKYFVSKFYDHFSTMRNFLKGKGITNWDSWNKICSNEVQSAGTCVASALSNATAFSFNYYTEQQIMKLFNKPEGLSIDELNSILIPTAKKLGFEVSIVDCTVDNIEKYINNRTVALLSCEARDLGYSNAKPGAGHEILLVDWYVHDNKLTCRYLDSNYPTFSPAAYFLWDMTSQNNILAGKLIDAVSITYVDGVLKYTRSGTKSMIVISPTMEQLSTDMMSKKVPANVSDNSNPIIIAYTFSRTEVRNSWSTALHLFQTDRTKAFNTEFDIVSTEGKTYKFNIYWIYGLAMHYMTYYMDVNLPKSEKKVSTGSDSWSYSYFKMCNYRNGLPNDVMVVDPMVYKNQNQCLITTLLFWLGELEPASDVFKGLEVSPTADLSLTDISNIISHYVSDVDVASYECTEWNINSLLKNNSSKAVVYLTSTCTKKLSGTTPFSFYDDGKSKQPFIIMNYNGTTIKAYSLMHRGSTVSNNAFNAYSFSVGDFVKCATGNMLVFKFGSGQ